MATLHLPQGSYRGRTADTTESFRGIPYAYYHSRFALPEVVSDYNPDLRAHYGEIDATRYGPICPQTPSRLEMVYGPMPDAGPMEEGTSCLSIYRPIGPISAPLAIMVYIHGGAFLTGSSQWAWHDGQRLAKEGVIVIPVSYRLGAFGFLYDDANAERDALGVQDLIAALEWIHDNAEHFGGDSTRICLFGQSAGGYLAQVLLDAAPHMFRRCIIQSSPAGTLQTPQFARACRDLFNAALPAHLTPKTASTEELLATQYRTVMKSSQVGRLPFLPALESPPGRDHTTTVDGKRHDIIIGWVADDHLPFAAMEARNQGVPDTSNALPPGKLCYIEEWEQASRDFANASREVGRNTSVYRFKWKPEGGLGSVHCVEIPLLLGDAGAWAKAPLRGQATFEEIDRVGAPLRRMWAQFANDGTPPTPIDGVLDIV